MQELLIEQAVKPQGWELTGQGSIPDSYNGLQRRPGEVALLKKNPFALIDLTNSYLRQEDTKH